MLALFFVLVNTFWLFFFRSAVFTFNDSMHFFFFSVTAASVVWKLHVSNQIDTN